MELIGNFVTWKDFEVAVKLLDFPVEKVELDRQAFTDYLITIGTFLEMQEKEKLKMSSRFTYVKYDDEATQKQEALKQAFENVEKLVEASLVEGRAKSLVLTHLEISYMWTGKQIRDEQLSRGSQTNHIPERG